MSEPDQEEDLLNEQELKELLAENKPQTNNKAKLNKWQIYCKRRGKKSIEQDYQKDLEEVGTLEAILGCFDTVNGFFAFYSSIKQPSILDVDTKLIFFLKGYKPFWEEWLDSGCLLITIKFKDEEKDKTGAQVLNSCWEYLLFSLIGNTLPNPRPNYDIHKDEKSGKEALIGIILSRREKISLIEVWYRNELHATQLSRLIEEDLRVHLKLGAEEKSLITMKYKRHKDSIESHSTIKGAYTFKSVANKSF